MTDEDRDEDRRKAERREFLGKCGRFGVVTPPLITLMLAVSDKATAQVTSPAKILPAPTTSATGTTATTATTGTTATTPTTRTSVTTGTTGTTATPPPPSSSIKTTPTQATSSTPQGLRLDDPSSRTQDLAMIIDGMGVRKTV
jgi:hypothetical protein